jgi:hypothetical protein
MMAKLDRRGGEARRPSADVSTIGLLKVRSGRGWSTIDLRSIHTASWNESISTVEREGRTPAVGSIPAKQSDPKAR